MRSNKMITEEKVGALIFHIYIEISLENLYVDIGA